MLARDLIEHIQMVQTFDLSASAPRSSLSAAAAGGYRYSGGITDGIGVDSLFFQLFGDIFQQQQQQQLNTAAADDGLLEQQTQPLYVCSSQKNRFPKQICIVTKNKKHSTEILKYSSIYYLVLEQWQQETPISPPYTNELPSSERIE